MKRRETTSRGKRARAVAARRRGCRASTCKVAARSTTGEVAHYGGIESERFVAKRRVFGRSLQRAAATRGHAGRSCCMRPTRRQWQQALIDHRRAVHRRAVHRRAAHLRARDDDHRHRAGHHLFKRRAGRQGTDRTIGALPLVGLLGEEQ